MDIQGGGVHHAGVEEIGRDIVMDPMNSRDVLPKCSRGGVGHSRGWGEVGHAGWGGVGHHRWGGVGWVYAGVGWGGSCRGGWGKSSRVGWVMQGWSGLCRDGVHHAGV